MGNLKSEGSNLDIAITTAGITFLPFSAIISQSRSILYQGRDYFMVGGNLSANAATLYSVGVCRPGTRDTLMQMYIT